MFVYSDYWKTWSRILLEENGEVCELNLTPVNGFEYGKLDTVRLEVIRTHGTAPSKNDEFVDVLPYTIYRDMEDALGERLAEKLVTHDYIAELKKKLGISSVNEIAKRDRNLSNGGGVPLANLLSGEYHYWR